MDISKNQAKLVTDEIDAAVRAILKSHGLTVGKTKTAYGYEYRYTITASIPVINDNGFDMGTPEAQMFRICAKSHGLPDADATLGVEFTVNGKTFIVTGYNDRAPKFCFLGKNLTDGGTRVKFPASWAQYFPGYDPASDYRIDPAVRAARVAASQS